MFDVTIVLDISREGDQYLWLFDISYGRVHVNWLWWSKICGWLPFREYFITVWRNIKLDLWYLINVYTDEVEDAFHKFSDNLTTQITRVVEQIELAEFGCNSCPFWLIFTSSRVLLAGWQQTFSAYQEQMCCAVTRVHETCLASLLYLRNTVGPHVLATHPICTQQPRHRVTRSNNCGQQRSTPCVLGTHFFPELITFK